MHHETTNMGTWCIWQRCPGCMGENNHPRSSPDTASTKRVLRLAKFRLATFQPNGRARVLPQELALKEWQRTKAAAFSWNPVKFSEMPVPGRFAGAVFLHLKNPISNAVLLFKKMISLLINTWKSGVHNPKMNRGSVAAHPHVGRRWFLLHWKIQLISFEALSYKVAFPVNNYTDSPNIANMAVTIKIARKNSMIESWCVPSSKVSRWKLPQKVLCVPLVSPGW